MSKKRDIWIKTGYGEFARFGPGAFTVDHLSIAVGKSRSSFYHLFGDMETYKDYVWAHHWDESKQIAMELDKATSFYPDFAQLLGDHKDWTFAHITMFHSRGLDGKYKQYFEKVTAMIEPKIGHLWTKAVGLDDLPSNKTNQLFRVIREAMFTRMDYDSYEPGEFLKNIKELNASLSFLFINSDAV